MINRETISKKHFLFVEGFVHYCVSRLWVALPLHKQLFHPDTQPRNSAFSTYPRVTTAATRLLRSEISSSIPLKHCRVVENIRNKRSIWSATDKGTVLLHAVGPASDIIDS